MLANVTRNAARLASLVALVSALALPSLASAQQAEEPRTVMIVGDSHVQRLGPMLSRRFARDGMRPLGYLSRPGWSTAAYRRAGDLREVLTENGRPDVVVISLGGNDAPMTRRAYRAQLVWAVAEARAAGAREIVWFGPATSDSEASELAARTGARHERNAEWQREILPELGVRWIDSRPMTVEGHGRDGIHFTRTGYTTWADGLRAAYADEAEPATSDVRLHVASADTAAACEPATVTC